MALDKGVSGYLAVSIRNALARMWNYQILLLVQGQVNGQNSLAQPRFTCPKICIYSYFSKKTYVVGIH